MRTRLLFGLLTALVALPLATPSQATPAPQMMMGVQAMPRPLRLSCGGSITAPFTGTKCGCGTTPQAAANDAGGQNVNPGGGVKCASCGAGQGNCAQGFAISVGVTLTLAPKEGPNGEELWKATFTAPAGGGDLGVDCEPCP